MHAGRSVEVGDHRTDLRVFLSTRPDRIAPDQTTGEKVTTR